MLSLEKTQYEIMKFCEISFADSSRKFLYNINYVTSCYTSQYEVTIFGI